MKAGALVMAAAALWLLASPWAKAQSNAAINDGKLAGIVPGHADKAQVRSLLGSPWRVIQFNDCGMAMDDQADETWEYRGADGNGGYRIHIEFGDDGVVHLIAKIPDTLPGGQPVTAKVAPAPSHGMSM